MNKPKKPQNNKVPRYFDIGTLTLAEIIKKSEEEGVNPEETFINVCADGCYDVELCYNLPEFTEEEMAEKQRDYEKKLEEYNKWQEENKEEIERIEKEKKEKYAKRRELEKQKQELEKEIQKLK